MKIKRYLSHAFLIAMGITLYTGVAFAQLIPVSLEQRIDNATLVVEGRVSGQQTVWDAAQKNIYTISTLEVYKLFKGQLSGSRLEIVTRGGTIGTEMQVASHGLSLHVNDIGIFTTVPSTTKLAATSVAQRVKAYADSQGFVQYDPVSSSAKDLFTLYRSISKDLYPMISAKIKTSVRVLSVPAFKIK